MVTKREQSERTKQAVLEAAAEEFDANGYIGGSIASIAGRLGMTKGSVAYHYSSKANLAAAIVEEEIAQIDQIFEAIRTRGLVGIDALVVAIRDVIRRADTNTVFRAAFRLNREHSIIDAELPRPHVLWLAHVERLLDEAQHRGEVSATLDTATATRAVTAMFLGEYQLTHELESVGNQDSDVFVMWEYLLSSFGASPRDVLARSFDTEATRGSSRTTPTASD